MFSPTVRIAALEVEVFQTQIFFRPTSAAVTRCHICLVHILDGCGTGWHVFLPQRSMPRIMKIGRCSQSTTYLYGVDSLFSARGRN